MTILFVKITTYVAVKKSIHNEMNKTFFIFSYTKTIILLVGLGEHNV